MGKSKELFEQLYQCTCEDGFCNKACWNAAKIQEGWIDKDWYDDETD